MISFELSKYCYGCFACLDVCPKKCIKVITGKDGFLYPYVDNKLCVNCRKCEQVCPRINPANCQFTGVLYSAKHIDSSIRSEGSSGSVFFALAKRQILKFKGFVVGAIFTSKFQLSHQIVDNLSSVRPMMKSKYIQSRTIGIYKAVKHLAQLGNKVLFVGTPCQCNAMYNYLFENERDNVLIVDFVCHGVPSQNLFDKSILLFENKNKCKISNISFREKDKEHVRLYSIRYEDCNTGKTHEIRGLPNQWAYYNGFLDHTTFRASCFNCQFKKKERCSDLTLGDFWGLNKILNKCTDYNLGYSMVVVNSDKGKHVLNEISDELILQRFPLEVAINNNKSFTKQDTQSKLNKFYLLAYSHLPFGVINNLFLKAKPKIQWRVIRKLFRILE